MINCILKSFANKSKTFWQCYREKRVSGVLKEEIRFGIYLPFLRFLWLLLYKYYGTDIEEIVDSPLLGVNCNVGLGYEPALFSHISKIVRTQKITPNDVFVDMGSGTGRVMIAAGQYPFKSTIGVDVFEI